MYLDAMNYIQNRNNVPIIYHAFRSATNKKIVIDSNLIISPQNPIWRLNMAISKKDYIDKNPKDGAKYWWKKWKELEY